ncbi:MAG: polymerase sigma factor SigK [Mycobacterium sp.]|nr:polymerase sigma factor SigK [Mycobacterium sp.]
MSTLTRNGSTVTAGLSSLNSLIERIAQGDSDALLRFYDRTSSRVFGVIGTLVRDPIERETLMERIYLEVWETAADFDADTFSPGAWLVTLAHRLAVEHVRTDVDANGKASVEVTAIRGEQPGRRYGKLSAQQSKCMELTYGRGMTVVETSERLGMSEKAVSASLSDAVDGLTVPPRGLQSAV